MRTFFGNASSIVLGLCLGGLTPLGLLHPLFLLLERLGWIHAESMFEAVVVSGQPQFVAARVIIAGCTIYCAAFMVANLALSHKRFLAMLATAPLIFLALFATFGVGTSLIDSLGAQANGLQAVMIAALVCLAIAYLFVAWAAANTGMQTKNIVMSRWAQKPTIFNNRMVILLMFGVYLMLTWN